MVFSFLNRVALTVEYNERLRALREQVSYRPFAEIEKLAQQAKGYLNVVILEPGDVAQARESAEEIIEDYRRHAHRVSAGAILNDLERQEKPYASVEEVDLEETKALRHLGQVNFNDQQKRTFAESICEAAVNTRCRVQAEQICEKLAAPKKPLMWDDFVEIKNVFTRLCCVPGVSVEKGSKHERMFSKSAAVMHRYSADDFLMVLKDEGRTMYFEAIDDMAATVCHHLNALHPKTLDAELKNVEAVVAHAKKDNIAEQRRLAAPKGKPAVPQPSPGSRF